MISESDRSGYIGASDTSRVIRSWNTRTFDCWWREKQGFEHRQLKTESILAGRFLEHRILEALHIPGLQMDQQKMIGRLRVNLDGSTEDTIYEVKTYRLSKGFVVSSDYRRQVNVEMYAYHIRNAYLVAYGLQEEDYRNYYREIEADRLIRISIEYDHEFIEKEYLPRLRYLSECLETGRFPKEDDFKEWIATIAEYGGSASQGRAAIF